MISRLVVLATKKHIMKRYVSLLLALIVVSIVVVQAQAPRGKFDGRWRVKFTMTGLEKNVIFEVKENGSGSFRLLDTGSDDKPVAELAPGVWSQLTNDRVSFSGETELPIGTCCREIGTMMFKGRFTSANTISGILVVVTSVDEEESPFKFRSVVGTFVANKMSNE
jgi:hypothetical protein